MSQLLTDNDLAELTGISKGVEKQAAVLRENGIGFIRRHDGKLATTWAAVNAALIGGKEHGRMAVSDDELIDYEAINDGSR